MLKLWKEEKKKDSQFNEATNFSLCHNSQLFNFISSHQFLQLPSIIDTVQRCLYDEDTQK